MTSPRKYVLDTVSRERHPVARSRKLFETPPYTGEEVTRTHNMFHGSVCSGTQKGQPAARLLLGPALLLGLLLPAMVLANVGQHSCVRGLDPCGGNSGNVKNNACNGNFACLDNTGAVGNNACVGNQACRTNTGASIGNGSCNGAFACVVNEGAIGNNSCNVPNACNGNMSTIGNNSCNAPNAYLHNTHPIGNNQCNTPDACQD